MAGRKATWDTGYGYELYLQGKSDAQIADACRVQTGTVTSYRVKRWAKMPDGGRRGEPAAEEEVTEAIDISSPVGTPHNDVDTLAAADAVAGLTAGAAMEAMGDPAEILEDLTGKEVAGVREEQKKDTNRMMEVIAKMTSGMGGIKAVCVGNIVQALWNLSTVDDIRDARNILDWLEENYDFG